MKRKIFKALLTLTLALAVILSLGLSLLAEEISAENMADVTEGADERDSDNTDVAEESNPFSLIYEGILTHSDKIFSLLSLIGTLIITNLYRRGLVPGLKRVTSSLEGALSGIKEETEMTRSDTAIYGERLESLTAALSSTSESVSLMREELNSENRAKKDAILSTLMSEQIELLCDIFMSSSLPEYKKEEVVRRINKMKEVLSNEESAQ